MRELDFWGVSDNGWGGMNASFFMKPNPPPGFCAAYSVLRTENIFVCCCGVGSDRVAGVGVSLGTLDLVRVDGRPCLGLRTV